MDNQDGDFSELKDRYNECQDEKQNLINKYAQEILTLKQNHGNTIVILEQTIEKLRFNRDTDYNRQKEEYDTLDEKFTNLKDKHQSH